MKLRLMVCLLAFWLLAATAAAGPKLGQMLPEDFSYKGVALGDTVETMRRTLGEELFDTDKNVFDMHVKYYTYKKYLIGVEQATGLVADIVIKDEDFRLRADVCRGSTAYKLYETYGKTERQNIEGVTYYVYENPQRPQERLLLAIDAGGTNAVEKARITSLPLTDEEAAKRKPGEEWQGNGMDELTLRNKDIDMSALEDADKKQAADRRSRSQGRAQINYHYEVTK